MPFVPFDATPEEEEARHVLRPGVPATMRPHLTTWIYERLKIDRGDYVRAARLRTIENSLDIEFGLNPEYDGLVEKSSVRKMLNKMGDRQLLHVVDFQLAAGGRWASGTDQLSAILLSGRSMYEVVRRDDTYRLATRVPEGVQDAAESMMGRSDAPGLLLRRAWSRVYDLEPDDSGAYAAAVKAVEAAAFPALGIPDRDVATLTHAIKAIEKRDATWGLPFLRSHTEYPSRDLLLGLLKSLYRGQRDRHGREAYSDVTHGEAEAAVLLAVTLVGWFAGGLVLERDSVEFR